jgi:hypothetical protein
MNSKIPGTEWVRSSTLARTVHQKTCPKHTMGQKDQRSVRRTYKGQAGELEDRQNNAELAKDLLNYFEKITLKMNSWSAKGQTD